MVPGVPAILLPLPGFGFSDILCTLYWQNWERGKIQEVADKTCTLYWQNWERGKIKEVADKTCTLYWQNWERGKIKEVADKTEVSVRRKRRSRLSERKRISDILFTMYWSDIVLTMFWQNGKRGEISSCQDRSWGLGLLYLLHLLHSALLWHMRSSLSFRRQNWQSEECCRWREKSRAGFLIPV